ncbi:MAG: IS3 family transposase [Odoribacter sp.]
MDRLVQQVYATAKGRYGTPRIVAEIYAKHHYASVNKISKYMKPIGLRSKYRNVNYPE